MATNTVTFSQVLIAIGDGEVTEAFAHPCLINGDKAIQMTANFSDDVVPDCDNPANPAQIFRFADSIDLTCSGTGKLHRDDAKVYADWLASGASKNAKIRVGASGGTGSFEISVSLKLTGFSISTTRPTTAEADVSFAADGFEATDIAAFA